MGFDYLDDRPLPFPNAESNHYAFSDSVDPDTDAYPNADADANTHPNTHSYSNTDAYPNTYSKSDSRGAGR